MRRGNRVRGRTIDWSAATYVVGIWSVGRLLVVFGFEQPVRHGVDAVANWDGAWYRQIATAGYEFSRDGHWHSIAFLPLYPALVSLVMRLGIDFDLAATALSNGCYLAMLFVVYDWIARADATTSARWTIAFMSIFPLSLFGSVAYAEATFMLSSALALRDFQDGRYRRAAIWSALASLARPIGICLVPAFAAATALEKRSVGSYVVAAAALCGAVVVVSIGAWQFHDAGAFLDAQHAWRRASDGGLDQWRILLASGTFSFGHWKLNAYVVALALALAFFRAKLPSVVRTLAWAAVVAIEYRCWGRDFPFALIALLGGAGVVRYCERLGAAPAAYAVAVVALLLASGSSISADRIVFGVVSFSIGLGMLFADEPPLAIPLLALSAFELYTVSAAFARSAWVA